MRVDLIFFKDCNDQCIGVGCDQCIGVRCDQCIGVGCDQCMGVRCDQYGCMPINVCVHTAFKGEVRPQS